MDAIDTRTPGTGYHEPVMVAAVVEHLVADPSGSYLDATAGGGGHSEAILRHLGPEGRLIALDRDLDAIGRLGRLREAYGDRVEILHGDFADAEQVVAGHVDARGRPLAGVLFDLGVSSHQIDTAARGFSYHQDGPLDMRMDCSSGVPAGRLIAQVSEADLAGLIKRFGEERSARRVARSICRRRDEDGMRTTADLRAAVAATGPKHLTKTLARVFQALRIAVNGELQSLNDGLNAAVSLLGPHGRLAVMSYHSLEDRMVKVKLRELAQGCICPPRLPVCACGRAPSFRPLSRKPIQADEVEVESNPRGRSARLRVYEKIAAG